MAEACGHCGEDHTTAWHEMMERASYEPAADEDSPETIQEAFQQAVDPGVPHTDGDPLGEIVLGAHEVSPEDAKGKLKERFQNPEDLPVIHLGPRLAENIDEASNAIAKNDDDVFCRNFELAVVTRVTEDEAESSVEVRPGRRALVAGTPYIHSMHPATLRERLTRVAVFVRTNRRSLIDTLPTPALVEGLFHRKVWPGMRHIRGVAEAPFLRRDGTICQAPGWDKSTGYLYSPSCDFPPIPDTPTRSDAKKALKLLQEVYVDFPFEPAAHASAPIAAILTILARPAIAGSTPVFLFTSNTPGTGKSTCTDTIAYIASGRGMPRASYTTRSEEQEKILGGWALRGAAFGSLDNIEAGLSFGGSALDRFVTAHDTVDVRVLGQTKMAVMPWLAVLCGTGNNIDVMGDMSPRVLLAGLETTLEDPRTRKGFLHDPLLPWVRANRGRLVSAALTILRAYCAAGTPRVEECPAWGSFDSWAGLIPPAIVWAGGDDPMRARIGNASQANEEIRHLLIVMKYLRAMHRRIAPNKPGISTKEIVETLYSPANIHAVHLNDFRGALEALCLPKQQRGNVAPSHQVLSYKLRGYKKRTFGRKRLATQNDRDDVALWTVEDVSEVPLGAKG